MRATLLPEAVVSRQVEAYNERDLEGFLSTYAEDAQIFDAVTGGRMMNGHQDMSLRYSALFGGSPRLHAEIAQRTTLGRFVVDLERVAGIGPDGRSIESIAVYEVLDGLIRKVWFFDPSN